MPLSFVEEGEYLGETGKAYLAVGQLGQANVWAAVQKDDHSNIVVLKAPSADDTGSSWPRFQHEMVMHELFKDCQYIRKQVDRVPPSETSPPLLVLEIFETTLWQVRVKRPLSKDEVRVVARSILQGLKEVHDKGLVYVDVKMQNIMLNGFDASTSGDGSRLVAKLGDLGIVMEPSRGSAQPIVYRAPEVFFKGELSPAADIWAFGLVVSHLLEAQQRFSSTGLYDDLHVGTGSMFDREQAMRSAIANDYNIHGMDYYQNCALPFRDSNHQPGQHWDQLRNRGLNEAEIDFIKWIMKADPRQRPDATTILNSDWLSGKSDPRADSHHVSTSRNEEQGNGKPAHVSAGAINPSSPMAGPPASSAARPTGESNERVRPSPIGNKTQDRLSNVLHSNKAPAEPGADSSSSAHVDRTAAAGGTYLSYR